MKCFNGGYRHAFSCWWWATDVIGGKKYFDIVRNKRLKYYRKFKYGKNNKSIIMAVIDDLSDRLIQVRKYEAPLCPPVFDRASYS